MFKNKYVMIGSCTVVAVVALAGATALGLHMHNASRLGQNVSNLRDNERITAQATVQSTDESATAQTGTATNIGVSSAPAANNLGQLSTSQPTSGSASTGSSGGSQSIDPSTFAQYEKYKDGTSALFGDVQVGTGVELSDGKQAAVYYKGWLTNGTLFDQSRTGSDGTLQPFMFTLGAHQVIVGWEQAMAGMKVGGTRLIIVPSSVGYGATGQGSIPGNATLVFAVQLLAVQ